MSAKLGRRGEAALGRPIRTPVWLFSAATASYALNCALGASVAARVIDTRRFRWVHHALYISTSTLAGAATSSLLWSESRAGWALLPAAVPLAAIPYASARTPRHVALAASAAPFFLRSLVRAWQEGGRMSRTSRKDRDGGS